MKLFTYLDAQGRRAIGALRSQDAVRIAPLREGDFDSMRALIAGLSPEALSRRVDKAEEKVDFESVTLMPLVDDPPKIICIGLNYESHRVETGRPKAQHPSVFARFANSQVGHRQDIWAPRASTCVDYEGELAVVIGVGGRAIAAADAWNHVFGYACYNDVSIRDWQNHTSQFVPGKNFPRTGAFGPVLVTRDEIPDIADLLLTTRLNGQVVQQARINQMIFDVPSIIEYCSGFTELEPGDVIVTGTPGGVGFKREPPLYMRAGDVVEVEIDRVGVLRNRVVDEPAAKD